MLAQYIREKGAILNAKENIIEVLELRLGEVPEPIKNEINNLEDLIKLKNLHRKAVLTETFADFLKKC